MRHLFLIAMIVAAVATSASAQTRNINVNSLSFSDSVSGTNTTTIVLGTTIQWTRVTGTHTVTNGANPSSVGAGTIFNFPINASATTATFTPTSVGTIQYHCAFHFGSGMVGTIIVQAPLSYPGSAEAFSLLSAVQTPGVPPFAAPTTGPGGADIKNVAAGQALTIELLSSSATFLFKPIILACQFFPAGSPPAGPLPGLHINTGASILIDGTQPGPIGGFEVLTPGGSFFTFGVPPGLSGQHLMIQGLDVTSSAANGFFAISEGHEIVFL